MASKTEADYQRVFEKLLQLRQHLAPQNIMADFEKATHNAAATVFPVFTFLVVYSISNKTYSEKFKRKDL